MIENKGNECRKAREERAKRLQTDANTGVGRLEHPRIGKSGIQRARSEERRGRREYTPVVIERVRKPLKIGGMAARRCGKECVIA
jgi:hypothetical protein